MKIGFLFLALFLSACGSSDIPIEMNRFHRDQSDTLYLTAIKGLRDSLDSICMVNFDANVQMALDSILKVRKEEEKKLRERIK
ncbi:MAG: hypothetical protein ACO388_04985 [Saprospiraceae bacterium]